VALPLEHRQRRGDAVKDAAQVHIDHRRPAVDVEVGHRADLADAGIAEKDVQAAEFVHGSRDELFDLVVLRDVDLHRQRPAAARSQLCG